MKTSKRLLTKGTFFLLLAGCLFLISCKQNDTTRESETMTTEQSDTIAAATTEAFDDNAFLSDAAIVNMEEIELGKLA